MTRPQKPNRAQRRKSGKAPASQRAAANTVRFKTIPGETVNVGTVTARLGYYAKLMADPDAMIERPEAGLRRYLGYDR